MKTKLTVEHPSHLHNNQVQLGTSIEIKITIQVPYRMTFKTV
jgi:hypothetical protein